MGGLWDVALISARLGVYHVGHVKPCYQPAGVKLRAAPAVAARRWKSGSPVRITPMQRVSQVVRLRLAKAVLPLVCVASVAYGPELLEFGYPTSQLRSPFGLCMCVAWVTLSHAANSSIFERFVSHSSPRNMKFIFRSRV